MRKRDRHYARATNNKKAAARAAAICAGIYREEANVLGRPGSDLLFQAWRLSTIGAGKFNGRVRDGIGFSLSANTTRPAKDGDQKSVISNQKIPDRDFWKQTGFSVSRCQGTVISDE